MKTFLLLVTVGGAALALVLFFFLGTTETTRTLHPIEPTLPGNAAPPNAAPPPDAGAPDPTAGAHAAFLYGRVTTPEGDVFEGRLRWGGTEEAFWDDYFNGTKAENPWAEFVPPEHLTERRPVEIFGVRVAERSHEIDLRRPFMVRFGDLSRLDVRGREIRVTRKSGEVVTLDRLAADDVADGLRVWDVARGVHDLHELQIRSVEFLPTPPIAAQGDLPRRLYGTVQTRRGPFAGFVQWNRAASLETDELVGRPRDRDADEEIRLPFGSLRSLARISDDDTRVTFLDGREMSLTGHPDVGRRHRGVVVDDHRFGRVLVPWQEFRRLDLQSEASGAGRAYGDFPAGCPLRGTVTARDGRRLAGRLVYDLDESETTETLDAPASDLHHTLPFGRIASIVLEDDPRSRHAAVTLRSGIDLRLERRGDLGDDNGGLLVFFDDADFPATPEYVPWNQVRRIDFAPEPCPSATTSSPGR